MKIEEREQENHKRVIVLDMENHLHYCDKVAALRREELKEKNIRLFFIPPCSDKLNLLEWVIRKIRDNIASQSHFSLEDLRSILEFSLEDLKRVEL